MDKEGYSFSIPLVRGHLSRRVVVLSNYPQEENDPREVGWVQQNSSATEKGPLPVLLGDHFLGWGRGGVSLCKWGWLVTGKQKITWRETLECHGRDDH